MAGNKKGNKNGSKEGSKPLEEQIRDDYAAGMPYDQLAKKYRKSLRDISAILPHAASDQQSSVKNQMQNQGPKEQGEFSIEEGKVVEESEKVSKSVKLSPQVLTLYDVLKSKNKWDKNMDLSAFINIYVLEHARDKDGVQISMLTTQIGNPSGIREVVVVENTQKKTEEEEKKSPVDIAKSAKTLLAEQIETNQLQNLLRASQPVTQSQSTQAQPAQPAEKPKSIAEAYMEYKMMKDIMKEGETEMPAAVTAKLSRLEEKIDKMNEDRKTKDLVEPLEKELKSLRDDIKIQPKTNEWKDFVTILMDKDKETAAAVSDVQLRLEEERNKFVETQMADLKARVNQGVQGAGLEKQMMDKITPVIAAAFDEKLKAVKGEIPQESNAAIAKDLVTSVLGTFKAPIEEYARKRGMGSQQQPAGAEAPPPGAIQITEEELNLIRQHRGKRIKQQQPAEKPPEEQPKTEDDPFIHG